MANQTWCGNFKLIAEKETIEDLQHLSNLLLSGNKENIKNFNLDKELIVLNEKDEKISTNVHTFLFFQDYFNYWKIIGNFDKVSEKLIFEDLFSRESYLEFDNVIESKDKFFNELLFFFNKNIFKEEYLKNNKFYKNLLISMAFAEIFKNAKNKIIIPLDYEDILLENIFNENIIQYKNQTFKKIFNEISLEKKNDFFSKKNILEYLSPFLKLGYSYEYKNEKFIYTNKPRIALVKNDFEDFFIKYIKFFKKVSIENQKFLLNVFIHHNRNKLALEIIENFDLMRESYSNDEFDILEKQLNRSSLNININSYFLNKKLTKNLHEKREIKKPKI